MRLVLSLVLPFVAACSSTRVPLHETGVAPVRIEPAAAPAARADWRAESPAARGESSGETSASIQFLIGARALDEDYWAPVDEHGVLGVEFAWMASEILGFELGFSVSGQEEDISILNQIVTARGVTGEIYLGPRLEAPLGDIPLRLYFGAGPSVITGDFEVEGSGALVSDSDSSFGLYAHGGALFELGPILLGLDLRILRGTEVTLFGFESDLDYEQAAFVFGVRF